MKKWIILDYTGKIHKDRSPDEIVRVLLKNRGISGKNEINNFLNPSLDDLKISESGINLSEVKKAVKRLKVALEKKESVVVYSDYDADGISSAAIVWETLNDLGFKAMPYVPHRIDEGYGLSQKGIDAVKKQFNASLIVTVDHGISGGKFISYARTLGIDVIVIDHHVKPEKMPAACAVIHTTQLAAAGVSWMFSDYLVTHWEDNKKNRPEFYRNLLSKLELAAIATVADLVPLTSLNRIIVHFGLKQLNETERLGLNILIKDAGLEKGKIGTYEVGRILAPRINAMGRLMHALDALRLLCTRDPERARLLSSQITQTNQTRQVMTRESALHAVAQVQIFNERSKIRQEKFDRIIIVSHESYAEGIIGLVAGRLVEEFYRPSIVISKGEKVSRASARSVAGFNIVEAIRKVSHLLKDVGGHPMAAGFTIETKNLSAFEKKIKEIVNGELTDDLLTRKLNIDAVLKFSDVNPDLFRGLSTLAPFGVGNNEPVFASFGVEILKSKVVGQDGKHLQMVLRQKGSDRIFRAIGFGLGNLSSSLSGPKAVDIAYKIGQDTWNGNNGLQLILKDVTIPGDI